MGYQSILKSGLFTAKRIVVTGGGSGIGRCIAHELTSLGAHVVLIGRKQDKLQKVESEIKEDGGKVSWLSLDIRDEAAVTAGVAQIVADGPIDGLVNNAGGQFPAPLTAISASGFDAVVRTNLTGGFLMSREVVKQSMAERGGNIVNIIADMWGGMPGMGHSGAARSGMMNFTMTAATEWAPFGVRVNAVAPGWIASSGLDRYEGAAKDFIPDLKFRVPLKRLGTEAEVSSAVCFLLSDGAAFITGATLQVDGGAPLNKPMWPTAPHDRSKPYDGFHRSVTPAVLNSDADADASTKGSA